MSGSQCRDDVQLVKGSVSRGRGAHRTTRSAVPVTLAPGCGLAGQVLFQVLGLVAVGISEILGCWGRLLRAEAGLVRFRPILLTSLTTFVGLMPMLFEKDIQAKFLIPIVVSLVFGVFTAFFVTLLMVPASYGIGLDIGAFFSRLFSGSALPSSISRISRRIRLMSCANRFEVFF